MKSVWGASASVEPAYRPLSTCAYPFNRRFTASQLMTFHQAAR
jgi:hypothetical protein